MGGGSPGGSNRTFISVLTQLLTCHGTSPSLTCGFFTCEVKAEVGVSDKADAGIFCALEHSKVGSPAG